MAGLKISFLIGVIFLLVTAIVIIIMSWDDIVGDDFAKFEPNPNSVTWHADPEAEYGFTLRTNQKYVDVDASHQHLRWSKITKFDPVMETIQIVDDLGIPCSSVDDPWVSRVSITANNATNTPLLTINYDVTFDNRGDGLLSVEDLDVVFVLYRGDVKLGTYVERQNLIRSLDPDELVSVGESIRISGPGRIEEGIDYTLYIEAVKQAPPNDVINSYVLSPWARSIEFVGNNISGFILAEETYRLRSYPVRLYPDETITFVPCTSSWEAAENPIDISLIGERGETKLTNYVPKIFAAAPIPITDESKKYVRLVPDPKASEWRRNRDVVREFRVDTDQEYVTIHVSNHQIRWAGTISHDLISKDKLNTPDDGHTCVTSDVYAEGLIDINQNINPQNILDFRVRIHHPDMSTPDFLITALIYLFDTNGRRVDAASLVNRVPTVNRSYTDYDVTFDSDNPNTSLGAIRGYKLTPGETYRVEAYANVHINGFRFNSTLSVGSTFVFGYPNSVHADPPSRMHVRVQDGDILLFSSCGDEDIAVPTTSDMHILAPNGERIRDYYMLELRGVLPVFGQDKYVRRFDCTGDKQSLTAGDQVRAVHTVGRQVGITYDILDNEDSHWFFDIATSAPAQIFVTEAGADIVHGIQADETYTVTLSATDGTETVYTKVDIYSDNCPSIATPAMFRYLVGIPATLDTDNGTSSGTSNPDLLTPQNLRNSYYNWVNTGTFNSGDKVSVHVRVLNFQPGCAGSPTERYLYAAPVAIRPATRIHLDSGLNQIRSWLPVSSFTDNGGTASDDSDDVRYDVYASTRKLICSTFTSMEVYP